MVIPLKENQYTISENPNTKDLEVNLKDKKIRCPICNHVLKINGTYKRRLKESDSIIHYYKMPQLECPYCVEHRYHRVYLVGLMLPYKHYYFKGIYETICDNAHPTITCEISTIRRWKLEYLKILDLQAAKLTDMEFTNFIAKILIAIRIGFK